MDQEGSPYPDPTLRLERRIVDGVELRKQSGRTARCPHGTESEHKCHVCDRIIPGWDDDLKRIPEEAGKEIRFIPIGDRVLVQPLSPEEETAGGIIIPDIAKEKPQVGRVLAVGPGIYGEDGQLVRPVQIKQGTLVLYGKYSGTEVRVEGEELIVLRELDVLMQEATQ